MRKLKKVKVGVLFFCKPATHLLYKQIFRRSMIFLTLVCTKRLSIYSNFFRKCLMGKRVDVSENLEATFVLSKFSFFLQNTFVFGEDDCSQLDKRTGRNSQSGDAKEEMKWRIGRLSFGKQNIQASYLTKIIWKGLYLLMIVSSKTFELYLWLSCFSFGFGFLRTLISGCFNCALVLYFIQVMYAGNEVFYIRKWLNKHDKKNK